MTVRHDLHVRQGETFSFVWTKLSAGSAVDLSGYTARMAIKASLTGSVEAYLSTGADADGGTITLGGALGTVTLAMTAAQTAALAGSLNAVTAELMDGVESRYTDEREVRFVYDLELISGAGVVTRELQGRVTVEREVTT